MTVHPFILMSWQGLISRLRLNRNRMRRTWTRYLIDQRELHRLLYYIELLRNGYRCHLDVKHYSGNQSNINVLPFVQEKSTNLADREQHFEIRWPQITFGKRPTAQISVELVKHYTTHTHTHTDTTESIMFSAKPYPSQCNLVHIFVELGFVTY